MKKKLKLLMGAAVIVVAMVYLVAEGLREAAVYFVTPSELKAKGPEAFGKPLRLGGMVVEGSLRWEPKTLRLSFELTDGKEKVAVLHKGTPPDLFGEGRGAVVEGKYTPEGFFKANLIMAKHAEEYKPPKEGAQAEYQELLKTLLTPEAGPQGLDEEK